jgi:hypothetical protein
MGGKIIMGWLISIPMMIAGLVVKNDTLITASAIFAVAGSINNVASTIIKLKDKDTDDTK